MIDPTPTQGRLFRFKTVLKVYSSRSHQDTDIENKIDQFILVIFLARI